jgi:hypothetical protein
MERKHAHDVRNQAFMSVLLALYRYIRASGSNLSLDDAITLLSVAPLPVAPLAPVSPAGTNDCKYMSCAVLFDFNTMLTYPQAVQSFFIKLRL